MTRGGRRGPNRPRSRVPGAVFRRVRAALGLTPAEVARALRIGRATYYRIEQPGCNGPPGLLLALAGLAVAQPGWSVADVTALIGLDPDADPPRTPDGRYAPILPPAELPPVDRAWSDDPMWPDAAS